MMSTYCYIRVSSADQNIERQQIAFDRLGIDMKTYIDKQSGKDFDRPEYKKMLRKLKTGDVLYIKSLDRLGRNYAEMQEQWRFITKIKGVDIVILDMSQKPQTTIEKAEEILNIKNNRIKVYSFLENFSKCEVYVRPVLLEFYADDNIEEEEIGLSRDNIIMSYGEQGITFDDKKLISRIFGENKEKDNRSYRWLRNKITHKLSGTAIKEVCKRYDELIEDMCNFMNIVKDN